MNFDISPLLNEWEYQPGQIGVRQFKGKDGIQKIQLRVDLGLLQMNAHGRPDGKTPYSYESLLEYFEARLAKHRKANAGSDETFKLRAEDCARLQQEAIQYHHRYICLFQLQNYADVIRDTRRNLRAFDLVENYAATEELAWSLQQFRPQVLMMLARARGSMALDSGDYTEAIAAVKSGLEQLREFYQKHGRIELVEQSPEIQSLDVWLKELQAKRPLTRREKLEFDLTEAIRREDYEKAAKVRDTLRNLRTSK
ncbi:MAG: UvrB/UvrC motif-containing protein [Verrucomicrobiia bacterium]